MFPDAMPQPDPSDLRAVMRQNEALKTMVGMLVYRSGGHVKLTKIDMARPLLLTCKTLPDGRIDLVAKHL